jgi:hypothetical protein
MPPSSAVTLKPRVTRAAHKSRVAAALLNAHPDQRELLAHLTQVELLALEGVSKHWAKAAKQWQLWVQVGPFPAAAARRIDDDQLEALLVKVDAKEHAKSVSLVGCTSVEGPGLVPVMRSAVLEVLDLRVMGESYVGELRASLSFLLMSVSFRSLLDEKLRVGEALSTVRINLARHGRSNQECYEGYAQILFNRVRESRAYRHKRSGTKCGECGCDACAPFPEFVETNREGWADPPYQLFSGPCDECGLWKCGMSWESRCDYMSTCNLCQKTFCSSCNFVSSCDICHQHACPDCAITTPCELCDRVTCMDCGDAHWCDTCGKPYCSDCRTVDYCEFCSDKYPTPHCSECRDVFWCHARQKPICDVCAEEHGVSPGSESEDY